MNNIYFVHCITQIKISVCRQTFLSSPQTQNLLRFSVWYRSRPQLQSAFFGLPALPLYTSFNRQAVLTRSVFLVSGHS